MTDVLNSDLFNESTWDFGFHEFLFGEDYKPGQTPPIVTPISESGSEPAGYAQTTPESNNPMDAMYKDDPAYIKALEQYEKDLLAEGEALANRKEPEKSIFLNETGELSAKWVLIALASAVAIYFVFKK